MAVSICPSLPTLLFSAFTYNLSTLYFPALTLSRCATARRISQFKLSMFKTEYSEPRTTSSRAGITLIHVITKLSPHTLFYESTRSVVINGNVVYPSPRDRLKESSLPPQSQERTDYTCYELAPLPHRLPTPSCAEETTQMVSTVSRLPPHRTCFPAARSRLPLQPA